MKDDDLLYVLPSVSVSVLSSLTKSIQYPLFESRETVLRSYHEGLYHITSDEAADKIIESQEMYASGRFKSYGLSKRCFFFGGVPDFENICLNVEPGITLTAVRVMLPYEKLAEFDRRGMNDGAITYRGDLSLKDAKVEKVRLGLKEHDGKLCYAPISEEEYQNYSLDLSEGKMKIVNNKLAFKLRSYMTGLRREFDLFKENFGHIIHDLIHDESSFFALPKSKSDYVSENSDLFEHTDEIPVINMSEHEEAISMFTSLTDPNNQNYQVGKSVMHDKNDVKAELLKGVVASVVASIQNGEPVNANTTIRPGMSDKDIMDALYANLCNGEMAECYNLLDNPNVLFSVCKGYVKNTDNGLNGQIQIDPRIVFLNKDIDNFNSNLKQNNMDQVIY